VTNRTHETENAFRADDIDDDDDDDNASNGGASLKVIIYREIIKRRKCEDKCKCQTRHGTRSLAVYVS
jgi:hypothetical protein